MVTAVVLLDVRKVIFGVVTVEALVVYTDVIFAVVEFFAAVVSVFFVVVIAVFFVVVVAVVFVVVSVVVVAAVVSFSPMTLNFLLKFSAYLCAVDSFKP